MARTVSPPTNGGSIFVFVAGALFAIALSFETQSFAHAAHFDRVLGQAMFPNGPPLLQHWYFPFDVLFWWLQFGLANNAAPWVHAWFAAFGQHFAWELGASLGVGFVLAAVIVGPRKNSDVHGDRSWATARDLRRSSLRKSEYGITLGQTKKRFNRPGDLLIHNDSQSVLGIGPPGEGKTDGIARPTLNRTWLHWSAIVFDPAAELTPLTAKVRSQHTRVAIFDPRNPKTKRYNPLAGIADGDVDGVRTVMAAYLLERDLAEMTEQERFFNGSALELGTALALHAIENGTPTFEAIARYYYDPAWTSETEIFESLLKSRTLYVQETAGKFARMSDRQRSPIVATLTQQLDIFRMPDVARATSGSDIAPADLRRHATTLYLVVREKDQAALNPLMRMVVTRFLDDLTEAIPSENEQPILLLIDEFPLLRAPIIQRKLATMRKYKIRAVLLAQTLTQIRDYYGQNESITGLCDVRVLFPSLDGPTQKLASDTCGRSTRWDEGSSRDAHGNESRSTREVGRPLLYEHELADMKASNEIVVYKKGERPIKARPIRAHADPRFH